MGLLGCSTPVGAANALEPTGAWNVTYEYSQCTASRDYGPRSEPIRLTLVPSVTGQAIRLLFSKPGRTAVTQVLARVRFGLARPIQTNAFVYEAGETKRRVSMVNLTMTEFKAAAEGPTIEFRSGSFSANLKVDRLPQVFGELDKCLNDLREYWNVRDVQPSSTAQRAAGQVAVAQHDEKLVGLIRDSDYPAFAINRGLAGTVGMTILIDEDGKVADCTVDGPSGVAILDATSCYILEKRAKYLPAQDERGNPRRGAVSGRIAWRIAN